MASKTVGHAEIDQQHELLDNSVEQLESFCPDVGHSPDATCSQCSTLKRKHCISKLDSISDELMVFLAGHSAYEEKLMELLPNTPTCQAHIKAHTNAHQGIMRRLKLILSASSKESPRDKSILISSVVRDWLGNQSKLFDARLVSLGKFDSTQVDLDSELVTMLDQFVFPNRPKMSKSSLKISVAQQADKTRVRSRFESLSPAQQRVFWLVVSGKSNNEICSTLNVSVNTIKTHRSAIFHKMDVRSVLELVNQAYFLSR
jgi:DNA-binding CsgD family transcriptional regulator/hemerythrin